MRGDGERLRGGRGRDQRRPRGGRRRGRAGRALGPGAARGRARAPHRRARDARRARRGRAGPRRALHLGGDGAADPPRVRGGARVRVTAVIVHWQDLDDTRGCVASLEGGIDVVVVDNASREPVGDAFAGRATTLRSPENLGYAGGANLGIRAALAAGAEVVLVLNNDARVRPGATAAACQALGADQRIAAVGPKVLARDDPSRLWLAWGEVTWRQSLVALRGAGEPDGPAWGAARDVDWIAGCAMWMRRDALAAVGLLDETFFAYHEEVDWCARARAAGWRVVYWPAAVVTHAGHGGAGSAAQVRIRKYFAARNAILYARRHGSTVQQAKLAAFLAATLPLELVHHWTHGTADEVLLKLRGIRDALARRRPPFEELGLK
ncbi:MAG: glycosyltransferase family 2 protein [Deltaproteobacteria bacterium]|nr:MAG: glycosyltransferase family 2 protein [Deltaproteobacteria bacterium]